MKIIVGLGNPGRKYERTRHNAGFMALDELARILHAEIAQEKYQAIVGRSRIGDEEAVLVKPQTFMNNSGRSVGAVVRNTYRTVSDLVVLHDDLDLPVGVVRVKSGGGHGGHNGLRSIIATLGSADFIRVRIGIGRPGPQIDPADYVLRSFLPEEKQPVLTALETAADAVMTIVSQGAAKAMNVVNQRQVSAG